MNKIYFIRKKVILFPPFPDFVVQVICLFNQMRFLFNEDN